MFSNIQNILLKKSCQHVNHNNILIDFIQLYIYTYLYRHIYVLFTYLQLTVKSCNNQFLEEWFFICRLCEANICKAFKLLLSAFMKIYKLRLFRVMSFNLINQKVFSPMDKNVRKYTIYLRNYKCAIMKYFTSLFYVYEYRLNDLNNTLIVSNSISTIDR